MWYNMLSSYADVYATQKHISGYILDKWSLMTDVAYLYK